MVAVAREAECLVERKQLVERLLTANGISTT